MQLLATYSIGLCGEKFNLHTGTQELPNISIQTPVYQLSKQDCVDLHVLSIDCSVQIEIMFALAQEFYKQ